MSEKLIVACVQTNAAPDIKTNLERIAPMLRKAREAATGVTPLYNVAGAARSRGAEFDLIYTPVLNYQMVLGYSRIWEAETLNAQDVRQIGVRLKPRSHLDQADFECRGICTHADGPDDAALISASSGSSLPA